MRPKRAVSIGGRDERYIGRDDVGGVAVSVKGMAVGGGRKRAVVPVLPTVKRNKLSIHSLQSVRDELVGKVRRHYVEALQRCSFAESYAEFNLSVILKLGTKFNDLSVEIRSSNGNIKSINRPVFVLQFNAANPSHRKHGNEEEMFIVNIESAEGQNIHIPSLVRFHCIDDKVDERGQYFFSLQSGLKVFSRLLGKDRKLAVIGNSWQHSAPRDIEGAVEIVNCIANNQGDICSEVAISKAVVEELFPRISIDVQAGAVSVRRGAESLVDIVDVIVGPLDLEARKRG